MPPEFLRSMLDGASDASFLVLSSGVIWHINEAARRMFNVVDGKGNSVSTYLSFCTTHSPGRETLRLTWQDVASPDSFVDDRKSVDGIGMRPRNGDRFPITISSVKISNCPRSSAGGQHTPSEQIGESDDEDFFYCLYIHDITPARLQLASLEEEVNRLSATKDAVIRASGQSLVVADSTGYIKSVSSGLFDMFGYEQGDQVIRQPLGLLLKENSCDLSLNDESRREVQGKLKNGGGIDLEIGISKICPSLKNRGYTAIMIKNITQRKENERRESLNDRISRGLRERSNILDAAFDPMFCTNKTGIIFMVNQAAVDQFGWSRGELIGQNVSMIVGGVHRHRHDSYMKRYMETGEKRMIGKQREIRAIRKNGTEFEAELGLAEISRAGEDTLFCGFIRDITQQKAYERKISDQVKAEQEISRELLNNQSIILGILDASFHALFVINEQCIIQKVNKMSCDVFGWKEEEFIGNNISMIMTKDVGSNHDQYITRYLETGMKKMIGTQREVTACRKDGSTFTCVLGLSETQDSGLLCGFIRDITSEKAAEAELIQERTLLTKILNASFDALLVINERGIIQKVNTASTRVFGWTEEEFIGKNINMIMPSEHAKRHDSYLERYIATGFKRMIGTEREVEARKKNGALFPCILGLTEVFHNGSRQFVGFIKDVTAQKSLLIVEAERQASDTLLHNILPENIARRLKQDPSHIADHYDNTTILFADIVGFTAQTSLMSPHDGKCDVFICLCFT